MRSGLCTYYHPSIESPRILVTSVVSKRRHMLYKNCQNSLRLLVPVHYVLYSLRVDELARVAYGRGCAYSIRYHIVWCVKYRRKIIAPSFVHPSALYSKHAQSTKGRLCTIGLGAHPEIRSRLWGGHVWNPSYFIATVSENTEEQIRHYIQGQKER